MPDTALWDIPGRIGQFFVRSAAVGGAGAVVHNMASRMRKKRGRRAPRKVRSVRRKRVRGSRKVGRVSKRRGRRMHASVRPAKRPRVDPVSEMGGAIPVNVNGGDLIRSKKVVGRPSGRGHLSKIVKALSQSNFFRLQGVNPFQSSVGYFALVNYWPTIPIPTLPPTTTVAQPLPLHMFNLTSSSQSWGDASVQEGVYYLTRNHWATGSGYSTPWNYSFNSLNTQQGSGAQTALGWVPENVNQLTANHRFDVLDYVDIRLDLIGPCNYPCKFTVQIVQFTEDHLCPEWPTLVGQEVNLAQKRMQFWDNISEPLISHPLNIGNPTVRGGMRVLHREVFQTDPKPLNDAESSGQERFVVIKKHFNRLMDHAWAQGQYLPNPVTATGVETMGFKATSNNFTDDVDWTKRLWLMVSAWNPVPSASPPSSNFTPTYDIILRKRVSSSLF